MYSLRYFYRHPDPAYFSLERVFTGISNRISQDNAGEFLVENKFMPFPGSWKRVPRNIRYVNRQQAAINHITGDIHYAILGCSNHNINILTVHDCVMLTRLQPSSLRYKIIKWLWYDLPVKKADVVTVISENTKKELLRFTKCDPDKIKVIPNFVDPDFEASPGIFSTEKPRILFVGVTPNKNLERLAEALTGISAELDIIGNLTEQQVQLLNKYAISWSQSAGLTREELIQKYVRADLLAFPSTYEGFGLPIVEAQAIGRPVLTSRLSPMQEVAGNGACLVDPFSVASIREGIGKIIGEAGYREGLVKEGYNNVKRFRLEEIAGQYAGLYRQLLQQKSK